LHVNIKDLAVAGTKDKRGVTVQRVSLRRGNKTVENVWKAANQLGRRSALEAVTQRGDRGIRIADLNYRKAGLELGMLKGNEFVITLRSVQYSRSACPESIYHPLPPIGTCKLIQWIPLIGL
jgi:tRNA pseudouridine13 synthase